MKPILYCFLLMLVISSIACTGLYRAKQVKHLIKNGYTPISISDTPTDSILFHYTGCAGFLIRKGNRAILVDPFFSNVGPMLLAKSQRIKTDTARVDAFFEQSFGQKEDSEGIIKAVLIAHAHYDHFGDMPYIWHEKLNQDSTHLYGCSTVKHCMAGAAKEKKEVFEDNKMTVLEPHMASDTSVGKWFYSQDKSIRFMAILSEHAPHFFGIKVVPEGHLSGEADRFPRKVRHLPEGTNFTFLIDFLKEDGSIDFRIFSNAGAASSAPIGFPSDAILAEHPVDVALICQASYREVKNYPEGILEKTKPKHVIFNHWENFFRSAKKQEVKPRTLSPITRNSIPKFVKRVDAVLEKEGRAGAWTLPNLNARMVIRY